MVPALVDAIKSQGLILVVDKSAEQPRGFGPLPKGIDGVLKSDGVLRFNESIDM